MTAVTISITEGVPAAYPSVPAWDFPFETTIIWRGHIWRRLEDWTRHRLGSRTVTYIAEGPGDWQPPLAPSTITTLEKWTGTAWEAVTLDASPLGGYALESETYRFTGTVGVDPVPEPFALAFVRLAEYFRAISADLDAFGVSQASDGDYSYDRSPAWAARAMQLSGAADLLRGFRNLGAE
jgi:hypothetical protein